MESTRILDTRELVVGSVIQYVLPLSQCPVDSHKLWRGKVTATFVHSRYDVGAVQVDSLEPGYEGYHELVHVCQIKVIEPGAVPHHEIEGMNDRKGSLQASTSHLP